MKKIFFQIERHNTKIAIIQEGIRDINYKELLKISSSLNIRKKRDKKKLVFIICKNNFETIAGYIGFLRSQSSILLLPKNILIDNLNNLLTLYKPEYIYLPIEMKKNFNEYKVEKNVGSYVLIRTNFKNNSKINKNLAILLSTSGSTGSPRLVRLSYENIISNSNSISNFLKIKSRDKVITTLPMNYTYGLSIINTHLLKGSTLVLTEDSIFTRKFWDLAQAKNITTFGGVPYTYEILKKIDFKKIKLPSIKYITQAGGKLDTSILNYFYNVAKSKKFKFIVMYGATEATHRMSYLKWKDFKNKKESIGKPILGGRFNLLGERNKKIKESHVNGELEYRGNNVCLGYASNRFDLAKGDENKKILKTGDIAYRDKQGFYYISGRKKRFVKLFGHRIHLDEIEKVVNSLGCFCACDGNDKKINIFLEKDDKIYINRIDKILDKKISQIKKGYKIVLIEKIPRNNSGKILYSILSKKNEIG